MLPHSAGPNPPERPGRFLLEHLIFILTRTVVVVSGLTVVLAVLGLAGRAIPDDHSFWSGMVFWSAGVAVLVVPAVLTWRLLTTHTRYAVPFAGCATLCSLAMVLIDSRLEAAGAVTVGMLLIFAAAGLSRR